MTEGLNMANESMSWWESHKPTKRRIIQLYSALLYNAYVKGFSKGQIFTGKSKAVCVPGLNCYSCPGAAFACPLGSLQNALGPLNKNIGFYVFGIILLYGMLLGRTICGWLCPIGLIQELIYKLPTPKLKKSRLTRFLSYLKYVILIVFVILVPIYYGIFKGIPVPGFCKYICPAGTLEGAMGMLPKNPQWLPMLGLIFTQKFIIMVIVILACIFCYRSFCRFLCPLGAIYGLFNGLSIIGIKVDHGKCNNCGACVRKCKMDVKRVGDHECIHCGQCSAYCNQKAISFSNSKLRKMEKPLIILSVVLLISLIVWTNIISPSAKNEDNQESEYISASVPIGYNVGERLADFEATCIDGSTFKLSENKGKIVYINLWATYCGPCVKELPEFVAFYHEHEEDVAVIAVHANLTTEDVNEYVSEKKWDIPIAIDDENEGIFSIVNGSDALPQTIVLNKKGEVIYNQVGSVSAEIIENLYQQAKE